MSEAICTWPSCGHTAKGQCGLRLVFDPVTRSAVRINPPPDLPPTLSAAMELPEVKALKDERDAATAAYWLVRSYAVHDDDCTINRYPNRNACSCGLRNALAAIKEPKT